MTKQLFSAIALLLLNFSALNAQKNHDTTYTISPVIITATQATERKSPVTFSTLSR